MSYMDTGEEEVDYGEAEDQNPSAIAFQPGGLASAYMEDDDMLQEEGYEDLYDDVNIGFFEPSPAEISSQKDVLEAGEGLGPGMQEDEVSFAQMKGLSVGSAHYSHQQNVQPEKHAARAPASLAKSGSSTLAEGMGSVIQGDEVQKQGGSSRGAEIVGATQPQVSLTLEAKPPKAAAPAISILIKQTRSPEEKDLEMPGIQVQASTTLKAKDENDSTRTAMEVKVAPSVIYPPQERGLKVNGMAPRESLPGLGLLQHEEYDRNVVPDNAGAGKQLDSSMTRARGPVDADRGYSGDGKVSQASGIRDSLAAAAPSDYTGKYNGQLHGGGGGTMLFVGELHWWTTDVELETALLEFGALKNLKFFEERASGKSKGYCQVEFYDHAAAYACKEGMNGRKFHGRPCLVAFANPRTILQMGTAQVEKAQAQIRAQQAQVQARRTMNSDPGGNTRGTSSYQAGDNTRNYGRSTVGTGRGSHTQTAAGRGPGRGRTNMGSKGNGGNVSSVTPYGQGLVGPMGSHPSGMMMPQAMMGQGYDPGYGPPRGGSGYGGYVLPGPPFTGMVQPFPTMGPGSLPGVAPHVNPAFFGRNSNANGMGMMGGSGMDGSQTAIWGDGNMNGWGAGEEHDRRGREASYDDDAADSDYTYSNELAYEKSRGAEELNRADAEWPDRRRHREREGYRDQRERDRDGEKDDWEREKPWRPRNKGRAVVEEEEKEDPRLRSREDEYGKRRRLGNER